MVSDLSSRLRDDAGSVTAEFAVLVPAVLTVLALCLGAVQSTSLQVRAVDAAADGARSLARGDDAATAAGRVGRVLPGAVMSSAQDGDFVCVTVSATGSAWFPVEARSCAVSGGR